MITRLFFALALSVAAMRGAENPKVKTRDDDTFTWRDLLPRALQQNPRLSVALHTEATAAGRKLAPPTAQRPTYYVLLDRGMLEAGDVVAGDRPPPPATLAELMKSSLTASGFQPATPEKPPALAISYVWGSYNHLAPLDPSESVDLDDPAFMKNVRDRAALVGGPIFAANLLRAMTTRQMDFFRLEDPRHDEMVDLALGDLYFVMALAYQRNAAGKKELAWTTVICTDSSAMTMQETLPALVGLGQTHFGHETAPTLVHPRLYGGHVEIGEPTVTGIVPDAAAK